MTVALERLVTVGSAKVKYSDRTRLLANTAGELEPEALPRRANVLEAFAIILAFLLVLWCLAYPFGRLMALTAANVVSSLLVAVLLVFALLVSPVLHGDTLRSRGLGDPVGLWRAWRRSGLRQRAILSSLFGAAVGILTFELYVNATGAGRFVLGIQPAVTLKLQTTMGGKTVVLVLCLLLSFLWASCLIRYDNLWPALGAAAKLLCLLLPPLVLLGWIVNGPGAFLAVQPAKLLRDSLGYVFWGAIQQLLFCSYFATRLRKGFRPAAGYFRPWKRLMVAGLSGFFFALVHINSWPLVGLTWILGTCLAWVSMQDRYRNVQALGLAHGVLGTTIIWLFGKGAAVQVRLKVGPWGMPLQPDFVTLALVGLILLGLGVGCLMLAWEGSLRWRINRWVQFSRGNPTPISGLDG